MPVPTAQRGRRLRALSLLLPCTRTSLRAAFATNSLLVTAFGHGYSPYLCGSGSIPLINRTTFTLPAPFWQGVFSMDAHGRYYDYIMVQGFRRRVRDGRPI